MELLLWDLSGVVDAAVLEKRGNGTMSLAWLGIE